MKRNKFGMSYYKLLSCDMGELVPVGLTEVLPGDTVQHATSALIRLSPMLAPVMHPVHVRIHHWFVPHRLVWEDFEDFITGGPDGMDASVFPTMAAPAGSGYALGSLADYLGVPPGVANLEHSALPLRAYALIYNEWYRDQDLQTELPLSIAEGVDSTTNTTMQNCGWEKDYFTSSRPWEQKGPTITIPIGDTAPVTGTAGVERLSNAAGWGGFNAGTNTPPAVDNPLRLEGTSGDLENTAGDTDYSLDPRGGLRANTAVGGGSMSADLSGASAVSINALREAFALQRYQEARARYGSRYVEYLRYLNVRSSDARLQRPEYLGGGRQTIQFSEVLQTAEGTAPVGELRGHGISSVRSNRYRRFFEEHGYVISLLSARPKTIYAQGLARTWNRRIKEDFWQMELQHIGQQEVQNQEVYAPHVSPTGTFGYQDRYDEYRRTESQVAGEFRDSTLDFWHMARVFETAPALNATFVECIPTERIFAVPSQDVLYIMARHHMVARRLVASTGKSFIY